MNGVIGMTGLLLDTALNDEQREYAETVRNSGEGLLTIINDILDFSKIEAGRLEIEHAPFSLGEVLENLAGIMSANAGDKDLELVIAPAPDVGGQLLGDALRLEQILINLSGNAIKFTDKGVVKVSACWRAMRKSSRYDFR